MSLLVFRDPEGDRVVVAPEAIAGLRVGRVELVGHVTLISTFGGTIAVSEQLADVEAAWRAARGEPTAASSEVMAAYPNTIGFEQQYPDGPPVGRPIGPPPWKAKDGGPR